MKVSLKKVFYLLNGKVLPSKIADTYEILNYIYDGNFMTHELPLAFKHLKEVNPKWFSDGIDFLNKIKSENNTNDFLELMKIIDEQYSDFEIEIDKIDLP